MPMRTVVAVAAAVLAGVIAASALASCDVSVGAMQHRTRSYSVAIKVHVLVVNAEAGAVNVIGSSATKVSVTERISFRQSPPTTRHAAVAGTLTLDSRCPALETCSVGYYITVPRATTVRVYDDVGSIHLQSLSGQITAHTDAGDIDLESVSGPVQITGHAGSILGQDVSSAHATLRTSAGEINVAFSTSPASVIATATVGAVTLRLPGSVSYAVRASASVGSTQISVSRNPASPYAITATTSTGSITIEPAR